MRGELVTILPDIDDFAQCVAKERYARNRHIGNKNHLEDGAHTSLENELAGVRSELAVRQFLGTPYTFDDLCLPKPDDGSDITIKRYRIDVKYSHHPDGHLLFQRVNKFKSDCAVLVVSTEYSSQLRIVGCISRKKFFEQFIWFDCEWCEHPILAVPQKKLASIYTLAAYLNNKVEPCRLSSIA